MQRALLPGFVGVLGLGLGVILMMLWNLKAPAFFRGETLRRERT